MGKIANVTPSISLVDFVRIAVFCRENNVDVVVVGPEEPLAMGLAEYLKFEGIQCFGPSRDAARIESSKVFAKSFMRRHNIPTPDCRMFENSRAALQHLANLETQFAENAASRIVIKASGLAAGKGVFLPSTMDEARSIIVKVMEQGMLGPDAGRQILIEDRISNGFEVSVLAFSDGRTIKVFPPVHDYKRLLDGDTGPNTGGMG